MAVSGTPNTLGLLGVAAGSPAQAERAAQLAAELGLPLVDAAAPGSTRPRARSPAGPLAIGPLPAGPTPAEPSAAEPSRAGSMVRADAAAGLLLVVTAERLELRSTARGGPGAVFVDFLAGPAGRRLRAATRGGELLARAAGLPTGCRTVLDATAGLGGDACLLALLGAEVTALERHPVVAALLEDGLRRALAAPAFAARLAGRLRVERGDAHAHLARLAAAPPEQRPDVVLIDPMFPELRSAAPRAAMQQFRALVGDDADADSLLPLARACARRRVVVKRPRHAPALGGQPPQVAYRGSSTRFDAYLAQPLPLP